MRSALASKKLRRITREKQSLIDSFWKVYTPDLFGCLLHCSTDKNLSETVVLSNNIFIFAINLKGSQNLQIRAAIYTSDNTGYCEASLSYCALILRRLSISSNL